jgi:hypothetical protein
MAAMPSHSPHALRPSTFQAPGWGAPTLLLSCCRWRSATSRKLVPFSHRLVSRIFIRQPGCIPSPMVTQDGDHQFDGGEKQARLRPLPHPQLQGSSSSLLGRRARGGGGGDFDNAGPIGRKRRQLQRGRFAGSAGSGVVSGATSHRWAECGYLPAVRAVVAPHAPGGPPKTSRAARAVFVFLGCPALAPVRRLCAEVDARPSGRTRVGICRWADGCRRRC